MKQEYKEQGDIENGEFSFIHLIKRYIYNTRQNIPEDK